MNPVKELVFKTKKETSVCKDFPQFHTHLQKPTPYKVHWPVAEYKELRRSWILTLLAQLSRTSAMRLLLTFLAICCLTSCIVEGKLRNCLWDKEQGCKAGGHNTLGFTGVNSLEIPICEMGMVLSTRGNFINSQDRICSVAAVKSS
jgi:hypothetical protein